MKVVLLGSMVLAYADVIRKAIRTPWELVELPDGTPPAALALGLEDAAAVVAVRYTAEVPPTPALRLLQVGGAGTDAIDFAAVRPEAAICNAFGHEDAMGEYAVMTMLAWCHRLLPMTAAFKAGSWEYSGHVGAGPHEELAGKTVGVVGLGRIGRAVAARAAALGARVVACNRTVGAKPPYVDTIHPLDRLDELLAEADFVVVTVALAESTRGLIDAARLAAMRPRAVLVNVARGPVVDEQALYEALRAERIGGAILDVWWRYPDGANAAPRPSRLPFHELANVIMTPHASGWTTGLFQRRGGQMAANLDRLARGEPLQNVVRPAAI
jgi:phosphoglycerate dehydrogenase-like enzyme